MNTIETLNEEVRDLFSQLQVTSFVNEAQRINLGNCHSNSYKDALESGHLALWWRDCALDLFRRFEDKLKELPTCRNPN